jgi:hypothetical protein
LNSEKIKEYSAQATKKTITEAFNDWIKIQYSVLDKMKDTKIDENIVSNYTFELQNFSTVIELENFQKQIQQQKESTKEKDILTI